jgi:parallel beta-helix repeat protein
MAVHVSLIVSVAVFVYPNAFCNLGVDAGSSINQVGRVHNLNTSMSYYSIQEAINAPETLDGHVLFLDSVVFFEHVVANKSVSLEGSIWLEHPEIRTVIDGNGTGDVVTVESDNVEISGIQVTNGINGIHVKEADNCTIGWGLLEIVNNSQSSIYLDNSSNCTILHSYIADNHIGVSLNNSNVNSVSENNITGNYVGIYLMNSSNNVIESNNITSSAGYGIWLDSLTSNSAILGNYIAGSYQGVYCYYSYGTTISANMITDNFQGIFIDNSGDSVVLANSVVMNRNAGIDLSFASNSNIAGNDVLGNRWCGISLFVSPGSIITKNNVMANKEYGFVLRESLNNSYAGNSITNNGCGVLFGYWSENNSFVHNNFVSNLKQSDFAFTDPAGSPNAWDNSLEGNYWDDYDGADSNHDGIGDSAYYVNESNIDRYPLMGAFSEFNATSVYHVYTISNSTITDLQFNDTAISFDVTGDNGTTGFCRICIPTALMNATYRVFVNGTEASSSLLPCSDATYSYLYFSYMHSTQEVIIITEFSSFLTLLLFMISTLIAIIIFKRRRTI